MGPTQTISFVKCSAFTDSNARMSRVSETSSDFYTPSVPPIGVTIVDTK